MILADDWSHTNHEWRETLDLARNYGWTISHRSGHGVRKVTCPGEVCTFRVFTTGNSPENVARTAREQVRRRCTHQDLSDALTSARSHADDAGCVLSAAEALLGRSDARDKQEQVLNLMAEASRNAQEAEALFEAAAREEALADTTLDELETPPDTDPADLARQARKHVGLMRKELGPLTNRSDEVETLRAQLVSLKQRLAEVQRRIKQS